jgi:hypothetical protein
VVGRATTARVTHHLVVDGTPAPHAQYGLVLRAVPTPTVSKLRSGFKMSIQDYGK